MDTKNLDAKTQELVHELRKRVSGEVRFDEFSRALYSTDASIYQMMPVGVVVPRSEEDVLAVMELAHREGIPVLPRGAGTSLSGQTVNHAIVLDFSKYMDGLIETNPEEKWALVKPGIVLESLNREVAKHGLHFAPDPSTANRSTVGGAIGNNSCGTHSILFGKTLDQVLELKVILSDGTEARLAPLSAEELEHKLAGQGLESRVYREVLRIAGDSREEIEARFPKIMRRVSGYNLDEFVDYRDFNLARVVVGSEGTLCVITEAKVKLEPLPKHTGMAALHFEDIFQACDATPAILEHKPAAVEFIDKMIIDQTRASPGFRRYMDFVEGDPGGLILVELFGESEQEVASKLEALKSDMDKKGLGYACVMLRDKQSQSNAWAVRRAGLGLLMGVRGDAKPIPFVEDTAVDPERLGEFGRRFDAIVRGHGTTAAYYGHASVGCLHIRPVVNLKTGDGARQMVAIAEEITDLVLEFGGSLSGEHGDGIARGVWTEKMFGSRLYQAFVELKRAFDPKGIMNPGKIVECPPMTENLRYGPAYEAQDLKTELDFSFFDGFAGAVEMCNGMGECRKMGGTMCPSYQATREEEHSTRGRANLLRAVLSGTLPHDKLTSKRLYDTLDLCLECKGCKGECPSMVDMAKVKYEFLSRYHAANGTPLRARLFSRINLINRVGCALAPGSNWLARMPGAKLLSHHLLGIHKARSLPPFARPTLQRWFRGHAPLGRGDRGPVVLFDDTFISYNYPQVGMAAVELLELAGFRVSLAGVKCCGRPMISKGMLGKARDHARYNVDRLYELASQGTPIVGCEPSCLLTFRDEYPDLLGDDKARVVAENSYLIDEFLAMLQEQGRLDLSFNESTKKILFHGHCHQKAAIGVEASKMVLALPPGFQVEVVDSGCCGMAGAFGYEKEHYDISMDIGDLKLFPAVRAKGPEWEIAVTGVSCRQQIEQGTGRRARHLVELLRDAVIV
ncbi:MAG: FAD-binding protein [Chloroflexi bacterium]|nr:FAD-binding protein [Chloroflexota bacterium]